MFDLMFEKDKTSKKPLYEQLYEFIASEIRSGMIAAGEKLPSKKALAAHLGISVNTVEAAYGILADEGYVRAAARSGHYVRSAGQPYYEAAAPETQDAAVEQKFRIDFKTNAVDAASFPYSTWIRLSREVMRDHPEYLEAGSMKGDHELRESIAHYLHEFRGVVCSPSQVIVGAGLEYLLMILTAISSEKRTFAVENPGYKKTAAIFKNSGRQVCYIGVDGSGLKVDELRKSGSSIVYVTPSHQFPTGSVMPADRRAELISWANEDENRYIIEDDYNSEFNFSKRPVRAIQAFGSRVIYMSTFSRVLAPSVRIAYMVLPPQLLLKFEEKFGAYSPTVSRFEQHTLHRFISGGYFSRHIARMKNIYRKRRAKLLEMLDEAGLELAGDCIGLHAVVRSENAKRIIDEAKRNGIRLYDMDDYFMDGKTGSDMFIIGYAGAGDDDIAELKRILEKI